MDAVLQDLRYAARSLRRQPAFALLAAIGTLALGIGANAAIFSVVNAVLLRPLAYSQPERIVAINNLWRKPAASAPVSRRPISRLARHHLARSTTWRTTPAARPASRRQAWPITDRRFGSRRGFFRVFGVGAELGRALEPADDVAGSAFTAVDQPRLLDAALRRPAGRGRAHRQASRERTFTIVGVMPPGFDFRRARDLWYPAWVQPETTSRGAHNYRVVARLKDGVALDAGAGGNDGASRPGSNARIRSSNDGKGVVVVPLQEQLVGDTQADAEPAGRRCRVWCC